MLKRVLSPISWAIAIFFLFAASKVMAGEILTGVAVLVWGLIFLSPLYRATDEYRLTKNIAACVVLFLFVPFLSPAPARENVTQQNAQPTPTTTVQAAAPTSTPSITVSEAPSLTQTLEALKNPNIKPITQPTEKISSKALVAPTKPEEILRAPSQNVPNGSNIKVNGSEIDPNTPVRAAVSGSCQCPYDTDIRGRSCGGRSVYSKSLGQQPICYVKDKQ